MKPRSLTRSKANIFEDYRSSISDHSGEAVQYLQYLPFGEDYINQSTNSWDVPYAISGKEKDAEADFPTFEVVIH